MRYSNYLIVAATALIISCKSNNSDQEKTGTQTQETVSTEGKSTANNENIASSQTDEPKGPLPVMTFEEKSFDFGNIKAGEKVRHTFAFTNTGEAPLVIQNASASCGCTVPEWPKEPIAPGEKGKIDVEFNTAGKSGPQSKTVSITANTNPTITTVQITSVVEKQEDKASSKK